LEYCRSSDSAIARIVAAGIKRLPLGPAATEKAAEDAGANEALKLRRNIRMLYALGSIATLLGLIGTISGMIKAFQVAAGGGMGKAELLARGIYEAMVNTFGGLAVAIVCTAFYYYFLGRIERLVGDMNEAFMEFGERYVTPPPPTTAASRSPAPSRTRRWNPRGLGSDQSRHSHHGDTEHTEKTENEMNGHAFSSGLRSVVSVSPW